MIRFEHVSATFFGKDGITEVLQDVSATFPDGKIIALTGPSGSGKTTCLSLLAGLLRPISGNVLYEASTPGNVTRETPRISYLFQDLALLPWLTALENVNLVLSDHEETLAQAKRMLEQVGLADAADRYPDELSGGMKQRVALARTLVYDSDLLLLDEPFRGLDPQLHTEMLALVKKMSVGKTTVLVTHDESDLQIADIILRVDDKTISKV